MAEDTGVLDEGQATAEQVTRARAMGWSDKDAWKGDPEKWVDAPAFLERGEQVLPIVNAHNRELRTKLDRTEQQVAAMAQELRNAKAALDAINEERHEDVGGDLETQKAELRVQIAAANRDGDYDKAAELTDKLTEVNIELREHKAKPVKKDENTSGAGAGTGKVHPEIEAFYVDNPEFATDRRIGRMSLLIAQELREGGDQRIGKAFMEDVKVKTLEALGNTGGGGSRVAAGNGGADRKGANGGASKGYGDLPSDAKAACDDARNNRFFGEKGKYKSQAEWRSAYASKYWAQA